jgi:hypothetical protein
MMFMTIVAWMENLARIVSLDPEYFAMILASLGPQSIIPRFQGSIPSPLTLFIFNISRTLLEGDYGALREKQGPSHFRSRHQVPHSRHTSLDLRAPGSPLLRV